MIKLNDRYGIDVIALVRDSDYDYVDHGDDLQKMMKEKGAKHWDFVYVIVDLETGLPAEDTEMYYPDIEDAYKDFKNLKRKARIKFTDVVTYYEDFDVTESELIELKSPKRIKEVLGDKYSEKRVIDGLKEDVDFGGFYVDEIKEVGE